VGTSTIKLPKDGLEIGLLMNAQTNQYQQQVFKGAKQAAAEGGASLTMLNANFDPATQINQLTNAATSKKFDAVVLVPIDGNAVCNLASKTLPQAGVLVAVTVQQICGREGSTTGEGMWAPGTLNYVGGDVSYPSIEAFVEKAGELNPGPQKVAVAVGPDTGPATIAEKKAFGAYSQAHPEFQIADYINTDYTTPTAYKNTLAYLQAHPDTTLMMSVYSPDLTRGVIQALKAAGKLGKIKVVDQGGSSYSIDQIKAGNIEFTMPYFPERTGNLAVKSVIDAVSGKKPERFVDNVPPENGDYKNPQAITKDNVDSFKPEY
jgi:ribose transport system substrate-binding protein